MPPPTSRTSGPAPLDFCSSHDKKSFKSLADPDSDSAVCVSGAAAANNLPSPAHCNLNSAADEQGKCLLSPVGKYASIGKPLQQLPAPWPALLGQQPRAIPSASSFLAYLQSQGIAESEVGGKIDGKISANSLGESARYFIIHDTSSLLSKPPGAEFPGNINDAEWSAGQLKALVPKKIAHVFIGRTGQSATSVDLGRALLTTKFAKDRPQAPGGAFRRDRKHPAP